MPSLFAPGERKRDPAPRALRWRQRGWEPGGATRGFIPDGTERGYAMLAILLMATLLLIALTVAVPRVYQEAQREREAELIFRGTQYARAIDAFHRQFQRFPTDVKELLETNGMRFLRQAYPDPMTAKGNWRFIHATASGVIIDSKLQGFSPNPAGLGGAGGLSQNPTAGSPFATSSQAASGSAFGTNPQPSSGTDFGASPQTSTGSEFGQSAQTSSGSSFGPSSQSSSPFSGQGQELKGAFIVGVASTSTKASIRVYNKRTRYDEWEFLGVALNPLGVPGATFTGGPVGGAQGLPGSVPGGAMGQPGAPPGQPATPTGPILPPQPTGPDQSGQQPPPN